ncbi:TcpQ domain-containing protein [Rhizobacter sp. Root1221]|uniref:TcpQ domain-containing protein n=1 Tax=Rhizobacter sp. Root1221 TaxID=1736433 RepID=UPI00138F6537|nr:TcpQ domain-containing protein [Rhizobacter sp. Root1221]
MDVWRAGLIALGLAGLSGGTPAASVHPYDFAYRISGDRVARPVQVFDDGSARTYFQFPAGATIPLILVGQGPDMVLPAAEGPYHVVAGRARSYMLVLAGHTAQVEHATLPLQRDARPLGRSVAPAPPRAADRTLSSYASPIRGDVIEWMEADQQVEHDIAFDGRGARLSPQGRALIMAVSKRMGAGTRVRVTAAGGPHPLRRAEQVRRALVQSGIAARHIVMDHPAENPASRWSAPDTVGVQWRGPGIAVPAPQPAAPAGDIATPASGKPLPHHFDILAADRTVAATLGRWARQSGYSLEWAAGIDAPITGELTLDTPGFPEAAGHVIAGLRASGYPLQLELPSDRVVRVVRKN